MYLARLGYSSDKIWNKVPYVSRPADKINKVLLRGIMSKYYTTLYLQIKIPLFDAVLCIAILDLNFWEK